jgi:tripartite ATP-independent transporter DctM subunit
MASIFIIYIAVRCRLNPELGPPLPKEERDQITAAEKVALLRAGLLPLFIFAVIIVPFVMGWSSLTEAAVIGALATVIVAVLKRRFTWEVFETCTRQTLAITCMFMLIIMAALSFGAVFDGLGAGKVIESLLVEDMHLQPWQILVLMQLSFLVMGMFLDDTAMLVIVAPLYVTLVDHLGYSLIWYGVLYTITCQIAYLTPPFGYNLFLMRAMAPKDYTLPIIYRSVLPFVLLMLLTLVIVMVFPQIALWLPEYVYSR